MLSLLYNMILESKTLTQLESNLIGDVYVYVARKNSFGQYSMVRTPFWTILFTKSEASCFETELGTIRSIR